MSIFKNVEDFTAQDARGGFDEQLEKQLEHCIAEIKRVMKHKKDVTIFVKLELEVIAELKARGFNVHFNKAQDQRETDSYTISW